jgi:hypothetical protein
VSDINTAMVDSLKALDPKRPIREAVIRELNISQRDGRCFHPRHWPKLEIGWDFFPFHWGFFA